MRPMDTLTVCHLATTIIHRAMGDDGADRAGAAKIRYWAGRFGAYCGRGAAPDAG